MALSIRKKDLDKVLKIETVEETKETISISECDRAPGYLNPWAEMKGRAKPYLFLESGKLAPPQTKIIISTPWLDDHHYINTSFILFLNTLFHHYPVYLWQGPKVRFSETKKLSNTHDFWTEIGGTYSAPRDEVLASLVKEGVATENMVILDYKELINLLTAVDSSYDNMSSDYICHTMKAQKINFEDDKACEMIKGTHVDKISCVWLNEDVIKNLPHFTKLKEIQLSLVTQTAINRFMHLFQGKNIAFYFSDVGSITIPGETASRLIIAGNLNELTINDETMLEKLDLNQCPELVRINILSAKALEKMTITDCPKLKEIKISGKIPLKKYQMKNVGIEEFDLTPFSELEKFDLTQNDPFLTKTKSTKMILNNPKLTELALKELKIENLDLASLLELKKISMDRCQITMLSPLPGSLEEYSDKASVIINLDLKLAKNLKKLQIHLSKANINFKNLETAEITDATLCPLEEMSACKELNVGTSYDANTVEEQKANVDRFLNRMPKDLEKLTVNLFQPRLVCGNFPIDLSRMKKLKEFTSDSWAFSEITAHKLKKLTLEHTQPVIKVPVKELHALSIEGDRLRYPEALERLELDFGSEIYDFRRMVNLKELKIKSIDTMARVSLDSSELYSPDLLFGAALEHVNLSLERNCYDYTGKRNIEEHVACKTIDATICKNLKELTINFPNKIQNILAMQLQSLVIKKGILDKTKIVADKLETLFLSNCEGFSKLDFNTAAIKTLIIEDCDIEELDLALYPKIEALILLNNKKLKKLSLGAPHLIKLVVRNSPLLERFSIISLPLLRSITTKECAANFFIANLPKVKFITLETKGHITVIDCPRLSIFRAKSDQDIYLHHQGNCLFNLEIETEAEFKTKDLILNKQLIHFSLHAKNPLEFNASLLPPNCIFLSKQADGIYRLPLQHDDHSLARISSNSHFALDGDTKGSGCYSKRGELSVELYNKNGIVPLNQHRLYFVKQLQVTHKKEITYPEYYRTSFEVVDYKMTTLSLDEVKRLKSQVYQNPDLELGYVQGELTTDEFYPLPLSTDIAKKEDLISFSCNSPFIELIWDKEQKQFCIKKRDIVEKDELEDQSAMDLKHKRGGVTLAASSRAKRKKAVITAAPKKLPIEIVYCVKKNSHYLDFKVCYEKDAVVEEKTSLLPPLFTAYLRKQIANHPFLRSLLIAETDAAKKLRIINCHVNPHWFTPEELKVKVSNQFELLWAIIERCKGVCRHRAQAFMVLAHFCGIPARIVFNNAHAFCEVPYKKNGEIFYAGIDLGGGPAVSMTPSTSLLANVPVLLPPKRVPMLVEKADEELKAEKTYRELFETHLLKQKIVDVEKFLKNKFTFSPLIVLSNDQNHLMIKNELVKNANSLYPKQLCLYIPNASYFSFYLSPKIIVDDQYETVRGPLYEMLENGGTLIINWDGFSHEEKAIYQSLLEPNPKLSDISFDREKVRVIGLIKNPEEMGSAFASRCQRFSWGSAHVYDERKEIAFDEKAISVNLFNQHAWEEELLGEVRYTPKGVTLKEGPLIQAMREGRSLIIQNPPENNEDFEVVLDQVTYQKTLYYKGDWLKASTGFNVRTAELQSEFKLENVHITDDEKFLADKEPIYLSLSNLHECYSQVMVHKGKPVHSVGLLESYQSDKQYFCLISKLPYSYENKLYDTIQKLYPKKDFYFKYAIGIPAETSRPKVFPPHINVYMSNDPAMIAQQIKNEHKEASIIYVSSLTTYSDLIADITPFTFKKQEFLLALEAGKTVILCGHIQDSLYLQLLTLLKPKPSLWLNGEKIEPSGRLILSVFNTYNMMPFVRHHFSHDDILNYFAMDHKEDVEKIKKLLGYAKKISHDGCLSPHDLNISYTRIKNILAVLQSKNDFHSQNPLKGWLHYDYHKSSEEYAFLNVFAKAIFAPDDLKPYRAEKLNYLLKRYEIKNAEDIRKHAWKLLNCFSGQQLRSMLTNELSKTIGFAELSGDVLSQLKLFVERASAPDSLEKKSVFDKQLLQAKTLLKQGRQILFFKGPAGAGKSYAVKSIVHEEKAFYGKEKVIDWLESKPLAPIYLVLDEANMQRPGTWTFLQGLSDKTIYYQGRFFAVSPYHIVLMTGNTENFPGRFFHGFLHHVETIYFPKPKFEKMKQDVMMPLLKPLSYGRFADPLLQACDFATQYNPFLPCSYREIQSLTHRFIMLAEKSNPDALIEACESEFSPNIKEKEKRIAFLKQLYALQAPSIKKEEKEVTEIMPGFPLTQEKMYLVTAIEQDLALRNLSLTKSIYYKPIILLEGPPGVGKSTLFLNILRKNDFEVDAKESQQRFYCLSAGSENVETILRQAYREGSMVILDEINADPNGKIEKLIISLEDAPPEKLGFMIFASLNSSDLKGRHPLSDAIKSRAHYLHVHDFAKPEQIELVRFAKFSHPHIFVDVYESMKKEDPNVNMRTFFQVLK